MVKRASRENARDRKCSEDMTDNDLRSPKKKSKYNLRNRNKNKKEGTLWIDDDTLETDDESYVSEIDSEAMPPINITLFIAQNKEEEESEEPQVEEQPQEPKEEPQEQPQEPKEEPQVEEQPQEQPQAQEQPQEQAQPVEEKNVDSE